MPSTYCLTDTNILLRLNTSNDPDFQRSAAQFDFLPRAVFVFVIHLKTSLSSGMLAPVPPDKTAKDFQSLILKDAFGKLRRPLRCCRITNKFIPNGGVWWRHILFSAHRC